MSGWIRNDWATQQMRLDPLCPPDACVYDKGDLRAFVMYADIEVMPGPRWHIVLASAERRPDWQEAVDAQVQLLPGSMRIALLPPPPIGELAIHICELIEQPERPRPPRWRWLQ